MASLSVEPVTAAEGSDSSSGESDSVSRGGLVVAVFDVPAPSSEEISAFMQREEEFDLMEVPFTELDSMGVAATNSAVPSLGGGGGKGGVRESPSLEDCSDAGQLVGLLCTASTDASYVARWGQGKFDAKYGAHGLRSIWAHPSDDILPCACYLRHCVLAVSKPGVDPRAR